MKEVRRQKVALVAEGIAVAIFKEVDILVQPQDEAPTFVCDGGTPSGHQATGTQHTTWCCSDATEPGHDDTHRSESVPQTDDCVMRVCKERSADFWFSVL